MKCMSDTTSLDDMVEENVRLDVDPEMMRRVSNSIQAPPPSTQAAQPPPSTQAAQPPPVHATLPPKHISKSSQMESLMQDVEASPTYVPPMMGSVPVKPSDSAANIVLKTKKKDARWLSFDNLIEDAKYPALLSLLYFLFQTPHVGGIMRRIFPFGYNEDCTVNTVGRVVQSFAFAICAFMLAFVQDNILKQLE